MTIATKRTATSLTLTSLDRACLSARVAVDNKARDVTVLDMRGITPLYDFFVLCTGNSRRQIHTISEEIDARLHTNLPSCSEPALGSLRATSPAAILSSMARVPELRGTTLMTVGELARRTGLSVKAIRDYEALGLIYSAGRSGANYRLYDETALWCAEMIRTFRSLGLTIIQIQEIAAVYLGDEAPSAGPQLEAQLEIAERRIAERIRELERTRGRIREYRAQHPAALAGRPGARLGPPDPRRKTVT